jgi:aldose sugar dehydrogenase
VYFAFSERDTANGGPVGTAVARARLEGNALQNITVIWRQLPKVNGGNHYGARLAFRPDKTLYVTVGDRNMDDSASPPTNQHSQNVATSLGKVVRINRDGTIPANNPNLGTSALPGLWSLGHRNPQGATVKPGTDDLWISEHGPQGGDEVNRIQSGQNYGWPFRNYGCPYGASPQGTACAIGGGTHAPAYTEPKSYWHTLSVAPSNLMFYTGDKFPEWSGNLLLGTMAGRAGGQSLWRLVVDSSNNVTQREEITAVRNMGERIRDVEQGPDGWIYLLTDSGKLIRVDR